MRNLDIYGKPYIDNQIVPAMPYMGNKRKLATKILNAIYQQVGDFENLYDLFGGGASMSVAGLIGGHSVHYNEKNKGIAELMKHLVAGGELPNKWISREEFNRHKNGDDWYSGFIKCCWSFGNNQRSYLFGKKVEEIKREAHEYLLKNGYDGKAETRVRLIKQFKNDKGILDRFELEQLEQLQQLQQLEQLEQLQQLQRLERLERLKITNHSYDEADIKNNAVIYCDPPYKGKGEYQTNDFNHSDFYKRCLENENPVFISEYDMPNDFTEIASFEHRCTLSASTNNKVIEKLYWNNKYVKK